MRLAATLIWVALLHSPVPAISGELLFPRDQPRVDRKWSEYGSVRHHNGQIEGTSHGRSPESSPRSSVDSDNAHRQALLDRRPQQGPHTFEVSYDTPVAQSRIPPQFMWVSLPDHLPSSRPPLPLPSRGSQNQLHRSEEGRWRIPAVLGPLPDVDTYSPTPPSHRRPRAPPHASSQEATLREPGASPGHSRELADTASSAHRQRQASPWGQRTLSQLWSTHYGQPIQNREGGPPAQRQIRTGGPSQWMRTLRERLHSSRAYGRSEHGNTDTAGQRGGSAVRWLQRSMGMADSAPRPSRAGPQGQAATAYHEQGRYRHADAGASAMADQEGGTQRARQARYWQRQRQWQSQQERRQIREQQSQRQQQRHEQLQQLWQQIWQQQRSLWHQRQIPLQVPLRMPQWGPEQPRDRPRGRGRNRQQMSALGSSLGPERADSQGADTQRADAQSARGGRPGDGGAANAQQPRGGRTGDERGAQGDQGRSKEQKQQRRPRHADWCKWCFGVLPRTNSQKSLPPG